MELWAHRGCGKGLLENTLHGFRKAVDSGFSAVEFDVMLSADGVPFVHHDWAMGRCAKPVEPQVWPSSETVFFHQLSQYDLARFSVSGHAIPSLMDVMTFCIEQGVRANVELKALNPQHALCLGRAVLKVLADWPVGVQSEIQQQWVFSSFYHASLLPLHAAGYALALLFETLPANWVLHADALDAKAVHVHHAALDASMVRRVHTTGRAVRAYTVNEMHRLNDCRRLGVDGVFTDNMALGSCGL